eukprot:6789167-Pyramimonas_sp.AAC.1
MRRLATLGLDEAPGGCPSWPRRGRRPRRCVTTAGLTSPHSAKIWTHIRLILPLLLLRVPDQNMEQHNIGIASAAPTRVWPNDGWNNIRL